MEGVAGLELIDLTIKPRTIITLTLPMTQSKGPETMSRIADAISRSLMALIQLATHHGHEEKILSRTDIEWLVTVTDDDRCIASPQLVTGERLQQMREADGFHPTIDQIMSAQNEDELCEFVYHSDWHGAGWICEICTAEILDCDRATELRCGHLYHSQCFTEWLQIKRMCMMCCMPIRHH